MKQSIAIPSSLKQTVRPSLRDAAYVPMSTNPGGADNFIMPVPYREQIDFATMQQCEDIISMIRSCVDDGMEVDLEVTDTGENRVYPPRTQFKYFNSPAGPMTPRIYQISGTIGGLQTIIEVGYFIQFNYQMSLPSAVGLTLTQEMGGIFPHWVEA